MRIRKRRRRRRSSSSKDTPEVRKEAKIEKNQITRYESFGSSVVGVYWLVCIGHCKYVKLDPLIALSPIRKTR